jgi:hypothetical protein
VSLRRRLALIAFAALFALPAAAQAAAPTYTTVKLTDADGSTEPRITVAPNDTRYTVTNVGGGAVVYASSDQGRTWTATPATPAGQVDASIDTDIVAMRTGRVLASELDFAGINFPSSYSDDGGKTWTSSRGSNTLVDQDRQWFAVGPDDPTSHQPTVYLLYHNLASGFASHNMWVAKSTDGGATFGAPVPTTLPGSDAWADLQCADSGGPSSIAVNPTTGRIYVTFTTRAGYPAGGTMDFGGCSATPLEFNIVNATRVWVATSADDSPGSWTQSVAVDDSASGQIVSMQLAYGVLDNEGGVWVAYPESPKAYPDLTGAAVKLTYQKPDGAGLLANGKWTKPVTLVAPSDQNGSTLVHIAAGDPGNVAIAYYKGASVPNQDKPVWYTHIIQARGLLSGSPVIDDEQISPIPAYKWTAAEMMGICSDPTPIQGVENGVACDRSTDVWGIALDRQCRVMIAWPSASDSSGGTTGGLPNSSAGTYVTTQTGGAGLCGSDSSLPGAPSAGGQLPSGRPQDCVDTTAPAAKARRASLRASRAGVRLRGTAADRGCRNGHLNVALKHGVKSVLVAIGLRSGAKCRFLRARGGMTAPNSCSRPLFLRARGAERWSFRSRGSLRAGSYFAYIRALDRKGNRSRLIKLRFTVR